MLFVYSSNLSLLTSGLKMNYFVLEKGIDAELFREAALTGVL